MFSIIRIEVLSEPNLILKSDSKTVSWGSSESWRRALLVFCLLQMYTQMIQQAQAEQDNGKVSSLLAHRTSEFILVLQFNGKVCIDVCLITNMLFRSIDQQWAYHIYRSVEIARLRTKVVSCTVIQISQKAWVVACFKAMRWSNKERWKKQKGQSKNVAHVLVNRLNLKIMI